MIIDNIKVTLEGEMHEDEIAAYVKRGREQYGHALRGIDLKADGEFVDIHYYTDRIPFDRMSIN